jgi:hypothetical protein
MAGIKAEPPYNPLDKKNLGVSVADALLARQIHPLPPTAAFRGAGIYALYYVGTFAAYEPLAARNRGDNFEAPIYVGKAVPKGARKGGYGLDKPPGAVLYKRLVEHAKSIEQAKSTLQLKDFACRYLVVDDIWIPLGESLLIERFSPAWNSVLDGFGIHDPGSGRYKGKRSAWDVIHPGRSWAEKSAPHGRKAEELMEATRRFIEAASTREKPAK